MLRLSLAMRRYHLRNILIMHYIGLVYAVL